MNLIYILSRIFMIYNSSYNNTSHQLFYISLGLLALTFRFKIILNDQVKYQIKYLKQKIFLFSEFILNKVYNGNRRSVKQGEHRILPIYQGANFYYWLLDR